MKKELIILLGILLIGISACAQDFASKGAQEERLQKKAVYQQAPADSSIIANKVPPTPAEPVEARKQSETECVEFWNRMSKKGSQVLLFDERHVRVSFGSEVTFAEAIVLLEKYNIEKEKITGIFIQPNDSEEEKYKNNRNIIGRVEKGKEIETACKILQESAIENAYPEVTLGFVSQ